MRKFFDGGMALQKIHCGFINHMDAMRGEGGAGDAQELAFFAECVAHFVNELLAGMCHGVLAG